MIVVIQCKDRVGLVAVISGILAEEQLNIVSMLEHVDKMEKRFFMRLDLEPDYPAIALERKMQTLLPPDAVITVDPLPEKKVVVLVSKEYHCLADILVRHHFKTLGVSVQCVIGNHSVLKDICRRFDMPFYLVKHAQTSEGSRDGENYREGGIPPETYERDAFERRIIEIIGGYDPDYIVLAKFMRILSPRVVAAFPMRIINIHHSFLPAFAGTNPYRQAFERGVKLIGATAHFVTDELDEGPIIAQQIIPVNHSYTASDMIRAGREIETSVLARALRLVFEDRVFVYRNKTVVFE
jgi:formyltetrahydrofolate deformylase